MQKNSAKQILRKALAGEGLAIEEANLLIRPESIQLDELLQAAQLVTRRYFSNQVEMCAIYPARVGHCSGDCAFCAQSVHHDCNLQTIEVSKLIENEIICNARELQKLGVARYSLVTSGERLTDEEFDCILRIFQRLKRETELSLCASLGTLTKDRANRLKEVGVSRYHHNLETSRSFFSQICSTHTYEDKLKTLQIARQSGLEICSGGIISMGETPEQRVEMAYELKNQDVDCIPINILNPIPGTRLANQSLLSIDEILRAIAVFRLILPDKPLRFAGGRENALGAEEYRGYIAGINALIVGNYLTTSGKAIEEEIGKLETAGHTIMGRGNP